MKKILVIFSAISINCFTYTMDSPVVMTSENIGKSIAVLVDARKLPSIKAIHGEPQPATDQDLHSRIQPLVQAKTLVTIYTICENLFGKRKTAIPKEEIKFNLEVLREKNRQDMEKQKNHAGQSKL